MIIGLTGPNASGKGEVALYLRAKGFIYYSLSDVLRDESKKLDIEPLRENLVRLGNELRRKNGPSFLASYTIKKLEDTGDYVIDSIRNTAEVEEFRKKRDFILVGIDAPVELRFQRGLKRRRHGDADTLQEFIEKEKEENMPDRDNQQLKKCIEMADVLIENNSTVEGLHKKMDRVIQNEIR